MRISNKVRVESYFAAVHSTYWMQCCCLSGFTVVYLQYRGFTDTQTGITNALTNFFAVLVQFFVAGFSDAHFSVDIKKIISVMYISTIALSSAVNLIDMPIAIMMIVYSAAVAISSSIDSFISAMNMQYTNLNKPLRYGWPRCFGSFAYASLALILGILVNKYSPAFLLNLHVIIAVLAIAAVLLVHSPKRYADPDLYEKFSSMEKNGEKVSYLKMVKGNPILILLLLSLFLNAMGSNPVQSFIIRLYESFGGDTSHMGIGAFCFSFCEIPTLILSTWLFKKFSRQKMVVVTIVVTLIRMCAFFFVRSEFPVYLIQCLGGLTNGLFVSSTMEFANMIVGNGEKVRAQSLMGLFKTLGTIIGNIYAGKILDAANFRTLAAVGIAVCSAATVIMIICSRMFTARQRKAAS